MHLSRALPAVLVLVLATTAGAVEVQPGVAYPGGTRVESSELGVAFTIPRGFQGVWPPGSEVFVMRSEADPGLNVLVMAEEASAAELRALMSDRIELGDGLTLSPSGGVQRDGRWLVGRYRVQGAPAPLSAYALAEPGAHGISIAFLAVASDEALPALRTTVRTLAEGATLRAPSGAASAPAGAAGGGDRWDVYLRGKYIVRYHTATGFTDEQHLWLCSDGTFARRGASGGFGGGASGAASSSSTGRWQASGAGARGTLTLQYDDGSVSRHELAWDYGKDQLFVDGRRWLHDRNQRCR